MMNNEFKLTKGTVMRYKAPVKNLTYIHKFGEGFCWEMEVCVFPEPYLERSKCVVYYSVDGSKRKYYLIEFYVYDNEDLETALDVNLEIVKDLVDWETMIADIEKDADEAWEDADK